MNSRLAALVCGVVAATTVPAARRGYIAASGLFGLAFRADCLIGMMLPSIEKTLSRSAKVH